MSIRELTFFGCILWSIWKVWNDTVDAQCFVLERTSSMLFEWEATCQTRSTHDNQGNPTRPSIRLNCLKEE